MRIISLSLANTYVYLMIREEQLKTGDEQLLRVIVVLLDERVNIIGKRR